MPKLQMQNRPGLAIALKLTAVAIFTIMAAMIKAAMEVVPAGEAVFFRSLFAMPVIVLWIWQRGELGHALKANNIRGHIWRSLFGTTAMGLTFAGLGLIPLPEATAIGYTTPIFAVILAVLVLGETVGIFRISAVAIGLVGVLVVVWPQLSFGGASPSAEKLADGARLGVLLTLAASMIRAIVQIHIRELVKTEHPAAIVFYFSMTASTMALLTLPFGWVMPDPQTLLLLCLAGLIGGVAQILITSAFRFGAASLLAPYDYASLIFATIIGFIWFHEVPTWTMVAGAALVIVGNVLVIWRERQLGLARSRGRSLTDLKR